MPQKQYISIQLGYTGSGAGAWGECPPKIYLGVKHDILTLPHPDFSLSNHFRPDLPLLFKLH